MVIAIHGGVGPNMRANVVITGGRVIARIDAGLYDLDRCNSRRFADTLGNGGESARDGHRLDIPIGQQVHVSTCSTTNCPAAPAQAGRLPRSDDAGGSRAAASVTSGSLIITSEDWPAIQAHAKEIGIETSWTDLDSGKIVQSAKAEP
jgi:hypothetical protein